jgi:hypothetical protein
MNHDCESNRKYLTVIFLKKSGLGVLYFVYLFLCVMLNYLTIII